MFNSSPEIRTGFNQFLFFRVWGTSMFLEHTGSHGDWQWDDYGIIIYYYCKTLLPGHPDRRSNNISSTSVFFIEFWRTTWVDKQVKTSTFPRCGHHFSFIACSNPQVPTIAQLQTSLPPVTGFWNVFGRTIPVKIAVRVETLPCYPLVNWHSYRKWPFIVDFPIESGDFP